MTAKPRILLIGIDPDKMDFSSPGVPAGVDAQMVHTAIAMGNARFAERGIAFDMLLIPPGETSDTAIVEQLADGYDCVVIGGGLRKPDAEVRALEMVIDAVRRHAPQAKVAFNTNPVDSVDAALRWL